MAGRHGLTSSSMILAATLVLGCEDATGPTGPEPAQELASAQALVFSRISGWGSSIRHQLGGRPEHGLFGTG